MRYWHHQEQEQEQKRKQVKKGENKDKNLKVYPFGTPAKVEGELQQNDSLGSRTGRSGPRWDPDPEHPLHVPAGPLLIHVTHELPRLDRGPWAVERARALWSMRVVRMVAEVGALPAPVRCNWDRAECRGTWGQPQVAEGC